MQQQYDSVHQVLGEIGVTDKPEILLLNKTDTAEGEAAAPFWRALVGGSIAISARTGAGLGELAEAVYKQVLGRQVRVELEADVTDGRVLAYLESHTRVEGREYVDGRARIVAVMGRSLLAELSQQGRIAVTKVDPADGH